jgi:hypothetical protein
LNVNSNRLYQFFKYVVYALLTVNIFVFYADESAAAPLQFPDGVNLGNVREAFSASIDTVAWVILLLMFELETYVLEDNQFTRSVSLTLHGLRAICYVAIVMAFSGYVQDMWSVSDTILLANVADLCTLANAGWSWPVTFGEYIPLTAANCATLSEANTFLQYRDLPVVLDAASNTEIVRLAWVDVINAGVWLLVVVVLEIDVWLQEHQRYEGLALRASHDIKVVLYSTLLLAAISWGFKGDFVDFWDAFLWLVAFVFIELNVFEWREEDKAIQAVDQEMVR